jgi:hypothetical protein
MSANARAYRRLIFTFSHSWFATVQEVLQADWHEVWHSPQPLPSVSFSVPFAMVLICFILSSFPTYRPSQQAQDNNRSNNKHAARILSTGENPLQRTSP